MAKVGLILLAAGASTRMGAPKQLLEYRGKPLVRHAAEEALASACRPVLVVLGCQAEEIRPVLADLAVRTLLNPHWFGGLGSSVRTGVRALGADDLDAAILALADQPLVTAATYARLVREFEASGRPIIASSYDGVLGVPALFARELFGTLAVLPAAKGCRQLIAAHPDALPVPCREAALDVDTPAEYRQLLNASVHCD